MEFSKLIASSVGYRPGVRSDADTLDEMYVNRECAQS